MTPPTSTITLAGAAGGEWDVAVIGAGPAGSVAARGLALGGLRVILLERRSFPRPKVCGDCLGALGVRTLQREGLGGVLESAGARPVPFAELRCGRARLRCDRPALWSVSRESLDSELARRAVLAGADLLTGVSARISPDRRVDITDRADSATLEARAIVLACGLAPARIDPTLPERLARRARIGLGCTNDAPAPRALTMAVGEGGYIGRVGLADGRTNWAAAIDPALLRTHPSPGEALASIWAAAAPDEPAPPAEGWRGTPALTRRAPAQRGNTFCIGDAAGYVEPITGEGMSWAIASGAAAAPCVLAYLRQGAGGVWAREHRRLLGAHRVRCALVARAVRHPRALAHGVRLVSRFPLSGEALVRALIGSPALGPRGAWA